MFTALAFGGAPKLNGEDVAVADAGWLKGFAGAPNAVEGGVPESDFWPNENEVEIAGAEATRLNVKGDDGLSSVLGGANGFAASGLTVPKGFAVAEEGGAPKVNMFGELVELAPDANGFTGVGPLPKVMPPVGLLSAGLSIPFKFTSRVGLSSIRIP